MAVLRILILAASFLSAVAFIFTHKQAKEVVDEQLKKQIKQIVGEVLNEQQSKQSKLMRWLPVLLPSSGATVFIAWVRRDLLD
jgi:hypothetical protein